MKDFDTVELRAARTLAEADFFWKQRQGIACRPVVYSRYRDKVKETYNRIMMRKSEGEL